MQSSPTSLSAVGVFGMGSGGGGFGFGSPAESRARFSPASTAASLEILGMQDSDSEAARCNLVMYQDGTGVQQDHTEYYGSGDTGISAVDEQSCESPPHQLSTINKRKAGDDHFSEESMLAKRLAVDLSLVPRGETKPTLDRVRRHGQHGAVSPGVSPQPRRKIIKSKRLLRMSRGIGEHDVLHSSATAFSIAGPAGVTMGAVAMATEGPAAAEPKPSRRKTTHVLVPLKPIEAGYDAGDEGGEDECTPGPTAVTAAAATRNSEEGCEEFLVCPRSLVESPPASWAESAALAMVPFQTADQKTQQLIDAVREHADREIAAKDMVSAAAEAMHQSFFGVGTAMHSMHGGPA